MKAGRLVLQAMQQGNCMCPHCGHYSELHHERLRHEPDYRPAVFHCGHPDGCDCVVDAR